MEEREKATIRKFIYGLLLVFAIVLVVDLAIGAFAVYMAKQATDDAVETMQRAMEESNGRTQAIQAQRQRELEIVRKKQFDQDTLCALNSDTNKCVCLHRKTGQIVSVSKTECEHRAARATDRL